MNPIPGSVRATLLLGALTSDPSSRNLFWSMGVPKAEKKAEFAEVGEMPGAILTSSTGFDRGHGMPSNYGRSRLVTRPLFLVSARDPAA